MNELEICQTLGILVDPGKNKLPITPLLAEDLKMVCSALSEIMDQRQQYGSLNPDLWLELIPWHSIN